MCNEYQNMSNSVIFSTYLTPHRQQNMHLQSAEIILNQKDAYAYQWLITIKLISTQRTPSTFKVSCIHLNYDLFIHWSQSRALTILIPAITTAGWSLPNDVSEHKHEVKVSKVVQNKHFTYNNWCASRSKLRAITESQMTERTHAIFEA